MGDTLKFEYKFGAWQILNKNRMEYGRKIIICDEIDCREIAKIQ